MTVVASGSRKRGNGTGHHTIVMVSGSMYFISSSFTGSMLGADGIPLTSSGQWEIDPDDGESIQFRIPKEKFGGENDRIGFYISSSGKIGVGTKDPETAFDVRDVGEDVDPKDRTAKTKILKISRKTQEFNTPITASIVSASGGFIGNLTGTATNVANDLVVDNTTLKLNTGIVYDGTNVRTISVKDGGIDSDALAANIEVTELTSQHITASGNISSSGNFMGSNIGPIYDDFIYLTPTDFSNLGDNANILNANEIENNGGMLADNGARGLYYANKIIPQGYKATAVKVVGSSALDNFRVYSSSFDEANAADVVGGLTSVNTEKTLVTSILGGEGNYASVLWISRGNTDLYGGYIKLVKS